jgi:flagellar basal-body rod modification protein FlgD
MNINRATGTPYFQPRIVDNLTKESEKFVSLKETKIKKVIENPKGKLDGNDFIKLFLESLKSQDPTSPVETKDMMVQTAQLTTVETNIANKEALEAVAKTLTKSSEYQSQFGLLPAIGKLAILKDSTVEYDGNNDVDFKLYFESEPQSGSISIFDKNNKKVKEISLLQYKNEMGKIGKDEDGQDIKDSKDMLSFIWDGRTDNGNKLTKDKYKIQANYLGKDGKSHNIEIGTNIVESIKFENAEPLLKLGANYVEFSKVHEIR